MNTWKAISDMVAAGMRSAVASVQLNSGCYLLVKFYDLFFSIWTVYLNHGLLLNAVRPPSKVIGIPDWNRELSDNVLIRDMNGVDGVPRPACLDLKGTEREE